jgi:hypothetical protein
MQDDPLDRRNRLLWMATVVLMVLSAVVSVVLILLRT